MSSFWGEALSNFVLFIKIKKTDQFHLPKNSKYASICYRRYGLYRLGHC